MFDNIFIERLWRTVKYENVYLKGYETVPALAAWNFRRHHNSLSLRSKSRFHLFFVL